MKGKKLKLLFYIRKCPQGGTDPSQADMFKGLLTQQVQTFVTVGFVFVLHYKGCGIGLIK